MLWNITRRVHKLTLKTLKFILSKENAMKSREILKKQQSFSRRQLILMMIHPGHILD
jgi:hypothetical protein